MAELRCSVYIAPPTPAIRPPPATSTGPWSSISCTLVYSAEEAVLIDTPITVQQTKDLIKWIDHIAPNRKLSYIYITHGHGDHFFGLPLLIQRFPEAVPVATYATVKHMEQQVQEPYFSETWEYRFPGQIHKPFMLQDRWDFQAIDCGHSDTYDSSILWVPDLKLAVCGDVVYGQVHQMLFEANTKAKRQEWIRAIEKIEALKPSYVVPGHRQAEEIDGIWHLASTKKYIEDFENIVQGNPKDVKEVVMKMMDLYPDRFNPNALSLSAMGVFSAPKDA
ncbi:unnamed protein product [Clonostachys rosea f. rosea IK726]|uniref:Metallo-beta-lactamase domain-containing protein n=2 Tax=Bionectria ochroleuca TaxID=29856 RepID=A0A0B7KK74_BIOOC|nr:unnamed protein product [Clonostachys rosea f. rosea IK726]